MYLYELKDKILSIIGASFCLPSSVVLFLHLSFFLYLSLPETQNNNVRALRHQNLPFGACAKKERNENV